MINQFKQYSDCLVIAAKHMNKLKDVAAKKREVIEGALKHYDMPMTDYSVLYVGFNPAILVCESSDVAVTSVGIDTYEWIAAEAKSDVKYVAYEDITENNSWDIVICAEEFFTFAKTDEEQINAIQKICSVANELVISSVKDYKNLDYKDKEFSSPAVIRTGDEFLTFTEFHNWSLSDRNHIKSYIFVNGKVTDTFGPFNRRTLYFKQLAKFCFDSGASHFLVHKNLMYKSLIKKNYEHVVSVRFDDEHKQRSK